MGLLIAQTAQARFLSVDPVQFDPENPIPGMFNRYAYVLNDPINGMDPFGEECVNASDGKTTCTTDDYNVSFPTPEGFPGTDPSADNYHYYNTPGESPIGETATRDWVRDNPTPGRPSPATPEGTRNDATPGGGIPFRNDSPVDSFVTTNTVTGNEVVVNATLPSHPLAPGIVVREVAGNPDGTSTINNYGEGNGRLQRPGGPLASTINGVWSGQVPPDPNKAFDCQSCP